MRLVLTAAFLLGVVAAVSSVLILIPVRRDSFRSGVLPRAAGVAALMLPLMLVLLPHFSGEAQDQSPLGTAQAQSLAPAAQDPNWGLMAHVYLGGPPPGQGAARATPVGTSAPGLEELSRLAAADAGNADAWLALAGAQRRERRFDEAAVSYRKALDLRADNADAWADYADALAAANGRSLEGEPARAIDQALRLDARHPKALWLAASHDLEMKRYEAALKHWQALRAALPADSPDLRIIDANIAEAKTLAAQVTNGR